MSALTLILWDGLYIPAYALTTEQLDAHLFLHNPVRKNLCQGSASGEYPPCDLWLNNLHGPNCERMQVTLEDGSLGTAKCDNLISTAVLYRHVELDGVSYWRVPRDVLTKLEAFFGWPGDSYQVVDYRQRIPLPPEVKDYWRITGSLYDYQENAVNDVFAAATKWGLRGSIDAQPRTGKTLISLAVAHRLGVRTLIMAHQTQLLDNYLSDAAEFTNIGEIEAWLGRPVMRICKTAEDFQTTPIALTTPNIFFTNPALYESMRASFSLLLMDEVHRGNSNRWSELVDGLVVSDYVTASATFDRKDLKQIIMHAICGGPVVTVPVESMTPLCHLHYDESWASPVSFGEKSPVNYYRWAVTLPQKLIDIGRAALQDVARGHSILIAIPFISQIKLYLDLFERLGLRVGVFVGAGNNKAFPKHELDRKTVLAQARSGAFDVTLAQRSVVQVGLTCQKWSMLYVVALSNNEYNIRQEIKRVCSPGVDRMPPELRLFVENVPKALKWTDNLLTEVFDYYQCKWADGGDKRLRQILKNRQKPVLSLNSEDFEYDTNAEFGRRTRAKPTVKSLQTLTLPQIVDAIYADTDALQQAATLNAREGVPKPKGRRHF